MNKRLQEKPSEESPENNYYSTIIDNVAQKHRLEPALIHAMIKTESNYQVTAMSKKGAKGLMQLMNKTAKKYNVFNIYDPFENINAGAHLMRDLLNRYNSIDLALAAYNSGTKAVDKYKGIPPYPETQQYVAKITQEYKVRYRS